MSAFWIKLLWVCFFARVMARETRNFPAKNTCISTWGRSVFWDQPICAFAISCSSFPDWMPTDCGGRRGCCSAKIPVPMCSHCTPPIRFNAFETCANATVPPRHLFRRAFAICSILPISIKSNWIPQTAMLCICSHCTQQRGLSFERSIFAGSKTAFCPMHAP